MPPYREGIFVTRQNLQQPPPKPRRWTGIEGTADYLGVTTRTVRNMIADGRIKAYRSGKRLIRVDLNEIDEVTMRPFGGDAA